MSKDPIVAGTDGSPTAQVAVDKAGELAHALGAPVHVVCAPSALEAYEWPARITAQEVVSSAADRLESRGVTVQTHLPKGDAALSLVAVAESENAQMIVMGNKGMTGIRRLMGSLPNRVSHQARCDVLIVPTQSRSLPEFGGRSIVVGDDSGATRALSEAIRLSKALAGELHIVSTSSASDSSEGSLSAAASQAARQGVDAITHPRDGDPANALLDIAERNDAAIIVIGSKGMHASEREWFDNTPDKLSHKGACSVLIVFAGEGGEEGQNGVSEVTAGSPAEEASA
jgi:nucleotide-binding universal stress UspA family protein